ncbi:Low-specificity L-threonine aldolase [Planococcus halocryophilus Or1]|uniref:Low specificity L-threonine aldolase n=1 Tax=Planococcus halocryophilus TaxID=1215089 RepID=A0A1C7DQK1_9BACL|nr:beta-eliminating lyase-related protein [Planococcus halocryophilus]ANU13879.1 low specificity L-threonine aldolase [Planococcus halocryophilus]EMF47535.1 Low-specificity L-threonine aldolase [Planococcus halocryophilus Or1]
MRQNELLKSYEQTTQQLAGHGPRNVAVLKNAFESIDGKVNSDKYGQGSVIEDFQKQMADFLGKEAAVFFPSGTMAQQIALRIWCDEKDLKKVAYHPLSHLEIHEEDGLKELHGIQSILLATEDRVIELEDVTSMSEDVACVLLELPQREIGGQLPSFETLEAISRYCREKEIKLHLDGARILECLPYYEKTIKEICGLFDSVYLSMYKGIGGIAGAILAGDQDFIAQSKIWKKRHGGDLISLYPYILSADAYFAQRKNRMGDYYMQAKELALYFNSCKGIFTVPKVPVTNMFHVHFDKTPEQVSPILAQAQEIMNLGVTGYLRKEKQGCSFEVSIGDQYNKIPQPKVKVLFEWLGEKMETLK